MEPHDQQENPMDCVTAPTMFGNTFRDAQCGTCYWSPDSLQSFTFLMSGRGIPVCGSMMLGDPDYARAQLRLACTFDDPLLQQIAVGMLSNLAYPKHGQNTEFRQTH